MKALVRLVLLPWRGHAVVMLGGLTLYAIALWLVVFLGPDATLVVFLPLFLLAMQLLGLPLGRVMVPLLINESLLLPNFRRRLVQAGLLIWSGLFGLTAAVLSGSGHETFIPIAIGVGTLVWACAVAMSVEKIYLAVILVLVFGPQLVAPPQLAMVIAGLQSGWASVLLVFSGALVLWHAFDRRLRPRDPREAGSPMAMVNSRWVRSPADAEAHARGPGALLRAVFEGGADYTLQRAIKRQRRRDTPWRRAVLFRAVLMPYDNVIGIVLNTVLVIGGSVGLLALALYGGRATGAPAHVMAYMALIVARLRCTSMGASFARMRPHLADLYLAVAPERNASFQRRIFDTLATVIPSVAIEAVLGGVLLYAVLGDRSPGAMLGALAIAALGMGAIDLSMELLGPRGRAARFALMLFTMALYVGVYGLLYIACVWAGTPMGLVLTGVPVLAASAGVFWLARDSFADQPPVFTPGA
ncbi:hypothetical protein [Salinisphaera hydrothermalis]|uniref:Uncharacterized protein n=1 Tax=Salinisphaera hydrothermalis (strain C41B8) TaxID=1304275 RepID=A0A084IKM1_SALHC|nr:hypothetical protein [Salinisphaera hydrothermalis]KEZ77255.1 hypothetical protein C41B8_11060 [Salinisphaera hydrothermalis C41B8]